MTIRSCDYPKVVYSAYVIYIAYDVRAVNGRVPKGRADPLSS